MTERQLADKIADAVVDAYLAGKSRPHAVLNVLKKADVRLTLPYVLTESLAT